MYSWTTSYIYIVETLFWQKQTNHIIRDLIIVIVVDLNTFDLLRNTKGHQRNLHSSLQIHQICFNLSVEYKATGKGPQYYS